MEETSKEDVEAIMHIKRELAEAKRISLTPNVARFLTNEQRRIFATKLAELGNIVAGALIIGQFLSDDGFRLQAFLIGITIYFNFYLWAYFMSRGIEDKALVSWKI